MIQFSRLITELAMVQTGGVDIKALCDSMDLQPSEVDELFERARQRWEEAKDKFCVNIKVEQ